MNILWKLDLLFLWRDYIELFFITGALYSLARWFAYDTSKPLLYYLYLYVSAVVCSYWLPLPTIYAFLVTAWPSALAIGLLLHQRTLQHNFVGLKAVTMPHDMHATAWYKDLVLFSLRTAESGKPITWYIQRTNDLATLCRQYHSVNAPVHSSVLSLIAASALFNNQQPFMISASGILLSVNCVWQESSSSLVYTQHEQYQHIDQALELTRTNDCIACIARAPGAFDVVAEGKIIQNMPPQVLIRYLKNYCQQSSPLALKGAYEKKGTTSTQHP